MALSLSNGLSSQKSPDTSYIHDIPLVPPQPVIYKEYKEMVPDISVASDITDNGSQAENLKSTYQEVPRLSKYFFQTGLTSETVPQNKSSLFKRNSYPNKCLYHSSSEQNLGINSSFKPEQTFGATNKNEDYFLQSKHSSCQYHAMNQIAFERCNEQFSSPKNKLFYGSSLRTLNDEQTEKELKCTLQNAECILHEKECKCLETFEDINPCLDPALKDNDHLSCVVIPNKPLSCTQKVQDCCCSNKQCLKSNNNYCGHEKHVTFDEDLRETENNKKRRVNKISYSNSDSPSRNCKNENCQCKSKIKLNLNSSTKYVDSSSSEEYTENEKTCVSTHELLNIWKYIKQQDEKINSLQEEIKTLTQNLSHCHKSSVEEIESPSATESDVPFILNILDVHGEKIQELQSQISSLSLIDMKSSYIQNSEINNDMLKDVQSKNCRKKDTCCEGTEEIKAGIFVPNATCHEQMQVTKTSASTMTSLTFENSDKLVYHKKFTVVTDITKHRKEMLAGCELREDEVSVRKNRLNSKGVVSNSRKKKDRNLEKCSPNLKLETNKHVTTSSSTDVPTFSDLQELKTPDQCENDTSLHVEEKNELQTSEEKEKTYPASFKNVLKHVNELILDNDQDRHKKKSPVQKTVPKSQSRHSRQKQIQHTSPILVDRPTAKTSKNKKQTVPRKSSSSNTSSDSVYQSPELKHHVHNDTESEHSEDSDQYEPQQYALNGTELEVDNKFEESATISRYGLSSPNLSLATQRYLENYGLVRDKKNFTKSARKPRTSLSKRYIS
ncbi:uncharacterized protein NPIL_64431 [Nephila pilipes]|uniref:Uncharacterized protein n=1 Tax=Nephila pilipes TaxID=299642 RepID=A0A8X6NBD5_NEPPI|nr:uncharacterized protein NPIL_64431 [Nephila pilipes]